MNLKFVKAGRTMGDECTPYNVLFDKECTVREAIDAILKENPNEYGEIQLRCDAYEEEWRWEFHRGYPHCEYRRGKTSNANILEEYMTVLVEKIDSCGGWGRMDYYIYLKK